ncbi:hypothetical protein CMI47_01985 [Candidatus Pacearchaeota archaeon]|nr:hypothetical protein [Candidatus Pacearchaeota archaeon]|tara:strand:- start:803 stop:985 length:183 start_codon:yes stop_codon:yes gene_type:complete
MANEKSCCAGSDVVTNALGKIGVNRSMMITLALLPFAWDGVTWLTDAVRSLWDLVSGVGA